MATFVVCTGCGKTVEIEGLGELPEAWKRSDGTLQCPSCSLEEPASDVLEEEVVYPASDPEFDDSFGGDFCEICSGSCRGH
jgi:DNA-directed RNA polymerase subunit M/transcription elongation factor TFIIS